MQSWTVLLFAPCLLLGQGKERPSFDGDALGMTLAQFRAKYPGASVDPFKGKGFIARQQSLKPRFAYKNPYPTVTGKAADTAYFFREAPEGPDQARLFSILYSFEAVKYPELKRTYTAQYGRPALVETGTLQNQAGYSIQAETTTWRIGASRVVLRQRSTPRFDRGMLDLLDEELQGDLSLEASP